VRKAQVKLAVYYLSVGEEVKARRIAGELRHEQAAVLASLRDDLAGTTSPQFWEIIDRGWNFEYLPMTERALLDVFQLAGESAASGLRLTLRQHVLEPDPRSPGSV
jgi:hypothetical protein